MPILLKLFWEFFKTGLFAIGGGMATLPFLHKMGLATGWFDMGQLADMVAVSESTPGPIGINMATYAGFTTAGVLGGIVATVGLVTPSVIIILIVSRVLRRFRDSEVVERIFYGIRPASVALIASAGVEVIKISLLYWADFQATGVWAHLFNWKCIILAAAVFVVFRKFRHSPIFYILAAAAVGVIFKL